jgi:hypothetical protein
MADPPQNLSNKRCRSKKELTTSIELNQVIRSSDYMVQFDSVQLVLGPHSFLLPDVELWLYPSGVEVNRENLHSKQFWMAKQ